MLTLHTAPGSCSRASHIALEEAGLDYQARYVDFVAAISASPSSWRSIPRGACPPWSQIAAS